MKFLFVLFTSFITTGLFAQTTSIYGKVTKGDGSRLKGTSKFKGYEDQLIITNFAGGTDNTATIEIEVPTYSYIADFRNMMNTPPTAPATTLPKKNVTATVPAATNLPTMPEKMAIVKTLPVFPIFRIDISVTSRTNNQFPVLNRQIILENVNVESCTDNAQTGTSKIKLKANRIGWIYITIDPVTQKVANTAKSGWDTIAGTAWTNF